MCLAVPAEIVSLEEGGMARVSIMGTLRDVALDLTPEAGVGDFVLVHAGFAIEVVDRAYAQETLDLIREMSDLLDDPALAAAFGEGS